MWVGGYPNNTRYQDRYILSDSRCGRWSTSHRVEEPNLYETLTSQKHFQYPRRIWLQIVVIVILFVPPLTTTPRTWPPTSVSSRNNDRNNDHIYCGWGIFVHLLIIINNRIPKRHRCCYWYYYCYCYSLLQSTCCSLPHSPFHFHESPRQWPFVVSS